MTNTELTPEITILVSNRTYDNLKTIVQLVIPAIAVVYYICAVIFDFSNTKFIFGAIVFTELFLGVFLRIAKKIYGDSDAQYGGSIEIVQMPDGKKVYSLVLNGDPEDIDKMSSVVFKVGSVTHVTDDAS